MKRSKKAIIWFRWDLRIEDKEALFKASILAEEIIPIITFNSKIFIPSLPEAVQKSPPPLSCRAIARHPSLRSGRRPSSLRSGRRFGMSSRGTQVPRDPSAYASGRQNSRLGATAGGRAQNIFSTASKLT